MRTYSIEATEAFETQLADEQAYWDANADKNPAALDDGIRHLFGRLLDSPWTGQRMEGFPDSIRTMKLAWTHHRVAYRIDDDAEHVVLLGIWGLAERKPRFSTDG